MTKMLLPFLLITFVLARSQPLHPALSMEHNRYIVVMEKTHNLQSGTFSLNNLLSKLNATILLDIPLVNGIAVHLENHMLDQIRDHPAVEFVERDPPRWLFGSTHPSKQTQKIRQRIPWGISWTRSLELPQGGSWERSVRTCVIDSGYDREHEDLPQDARVTGGGPIDWGRDGCSHGTHVAGTIVAVDNNVGVIGVGQELAIHNIRVFDDNCRWIFASSTLAAAQDCVDARSDIVSMSLGCTSPFDWQCSSAAEARGFQTLMDNGVLSIAAAGNAGTTWNSFPASYDAVMSVAASDINGNIAGFSQRNAQVEIAAPGVAVESTVEMGTGDTENTIIDGNFVQTLALQGSATGNQQGELVDCGLGTDVCAGAVDKICLIERGVNSFAEKALNCLTGGGTGVLIYNNEPGLFAGMFEDALVQNMIVLALSQADGRETLLSMQTRSITASLKAGPGNYRYFDGTSMATPHVSGIAAKVWTLLPNATSSQLRLALQQGSSIPNAAAGTRDTAFGYGIVDAVNVYKALQKLL